MVGERGASEGVGGRRERRSESKEWDEDVVRCCKRNKEMRMYERGNV